CRVAICYITYLLSVPIAHNILGLSLPPAFISVVHLFRPAVHVLLPCRGFSFIIYLCAASVLAAVAANPLRPAFPPVIMLQYTVSQLLSLNKSSIPLSTSVIRHLGLLRRPRYIHRSTRRSFVYFQHGQTSIPSICSTQHTVAHLRRHQSAPPTVPLKLHGIPGPDSTPLRLPTQPAPPQSQLHRIPGADSTPLRLPICITNQFSPTVPLTLHRIPGPDSTPLRFPTQPAPPHSQLHRIPGADSTPLRLPISITNQFSLPPCPPPLLHHHPPSPPHPR
ncbi:hypothetical protein JOQ06_010865, partial [Pogonophryne albipinna]